MDDEDRPLGVVLTVDRGPLPFALLHGESLVACAAWALGAAEVDIVDLTVPWSTIRDAGRTVVLHDALCPATPPEFIAECIALAEQRAEAVVAVRPVTDTLKERHDGLVGANVDRESMLAPASPIVLPAAVVAGLTEPPPTDVVALVEQLRRSVPVAWAEAPAQARRVTDEADLAVLAAATAPEL